MQLDPKNSYRIESIPQNEGLKLFSQIEALPQDEVMSKLHLHFQCLFEEDKAYYFVQVIHCRRRTCDIQCGWTVKREYAFYLDPLMKLLRLFKEGNIRMPIQYYVSFLRRVQDGDEGTQHVPCNERSILIGER